jgi:hypothetical protein
VFERELDTATPGDLAQVAEQLGTIRGKFLKMVLHDATKEFDPAVRTGFGQDGTAADVDADFAAVRGTLDTNKFVDQMNAEIASLAERLDRFQQSLAKLAAG